MAITFQSLVVRSPRRVRLVFSEALAAGAFDPAWFAVACSDAAGADPAVSEVLVVPDAPHNAELSLGMDLVGGGAYQVTVVTGLPALAGSTTAADATHAFVTSEARPRPSAALAADANVDSLYGRDLVWDGEDFVEDASGDLGSIGGATNVRAAGSRALEANGLPWDETYGAHLRRFVDAPVPAVPELRGIAAATLLRDDRFKSVTGSVRSSPSDNPSLSRVAIDAVLVADQPVTLDAQVGS